MFQDCLCRVFCCAMWDIWTARNKLLHEGQHSTFVAEAMACFQAAEMGLQLGFLRVEIEGDSLAVIRKLKEERVERSVIGAYICNIRTICEQYQDCLSMCQNMQTGLHISWQQRD